ncbi:ATP-grasp domain-containing protein [Lysobacter sp. KIS68-7]|uniref:HAD-IA family hydrolase n=1 Tax=Lysobacter sp. KIS68-7 TaxID=2904252 RepID=UPI001E585686|nr:HAD-IA family hydrolase [Lysobacter sp. KIS68-7]UHQ20005.1 ATP-grasp domain-containing protein [Lysobacter sp. KIS68-7]
MNQAAPVRCILLLSAGGFQGQGLFEAVRRIDGARVIVGDIYAEGVTRYLSADYRRLPPLSKRDAFVASLDAMVEQDKVTAIFPSTAFELPLLAELRETLAARGVAVAVSSSDALAVLLDKGATARFLVEHDIATQVPVDARTHDFATPLFGRPHGGWGGRDTRRLDDSAARDRLLAEGALDDYVWTEFLPSFEELSVDFAIRTDGTLSPLVMRKRLRTSGGFAVISESVDDPVALALAERTARAIAAIGGAGLFNIQLLHTQPDNRLLVSDINPRFGTSSGHALGEGLNLPAFFLGDAAQSGARHGVKTVRKLQDITVARLPSRPQALVFDLDDTLLDHKRWFAAKALAAGDAVARDWGDAELFRETALGLVDEGERRLFIDQLALRLGWTRAQHAQFLDAFRAARVDAPLFADVPDSLAALRAMGFMLALLTDNPPATQKQKLERAPALGAFDAIVFSQDVGAEKPDERAFHAVSTALRLPPAQLCMIGDNLFRDGLGALRAGYGGAIVLRRPGGFIQPHEDLARLSTFGADPRLVHATDLVVAREILQGS